MKDPLVRAFLVMLVLAFAVGIALAVRALIAQGSAETASDRQSPAKSGSGALDAFNRELNAAAQRFSELLKDAQPKAEPPVPQQQRRAEQDAGAKAKLPALPVSDPRRAFPAATAPGGAHSAAIPVGGKWTYDVYFGPAWTRTGQLRYATQRQAGQAAPGATMSWVPDSGKISTWFLGVMEAGHPSHANTRFPGFFMHPAYLPTSMPAGSRIAWAIPWQGGGTGQLRRFEMLVTGWETVSVQAGEFNAVHLAGTLRYLDHEAVKAEVRYEIWYAPQVRQIVRVLWLGRSPDEAGAQMIAELASYDIP